MPGGVSWLVCPRFSLCRSARRKKGCLMDRSVDAPYVLIRDPPLHLDWHEGLTEAVPCKQRSCPQQSADTLRTARSLDTCVQAGPPQRRKEPRQQNREQTNSPWLGEGVDQPPHRRNGLLARMLLEIFALVDGLGNGSYVAV